MLFLTRGELIVKKRLAKGYSISDLAKALNASESEVDSWEKGELPDSKYLVELSRILDVEIEDILAEDKSVDTPTKFNELDSLYSVKSEQVTNENSDTYENSDGLHSNGYCFIERIFGYIIFTIFIIATIVLLVNRTKSNKIIGDSELTLENYRKYIDIEIETNKLNSLDSYSVTITSNKTITNFEIYIETDFLGFNSYTTYEKEVVLSGFLSPDNELKKEIQFTEFVVLQWYSVSYIKGGIK